MSAGLLGRTHRSSVGGFIGIRPGVVTMRRPDYGVTGTDVELRRGNEVSLQCTGEYIPQSWCKFAVHTLV